MQPPPDTIARCLTSEAAVRVVMVLATGVAREAARRHGAGGAATVALGRAATAGLLLATLTKGDDERVTLQILGNGPLGALTADATGAGTVRAFVQNPLALAAPASAAAGGRRAIGAAVGRKGLVSVIRDLGLKDNVTGQTEIVDGEIDTDVERYLTASEQLESALACETLLGDDGEVQVAAGVLVQALPASHGGELVEAARARLRGGALAAALAAAVRAPYADQEAALDPAALGRAALDEEHVRDLVVLDVRPVRFACPCSRERATATLTLMGEAELAEMIREDGQAEVSCNFCRARYHFSDADLEEIRRTARKQSVPPS
jgi:molecular chaperone Hsp33